MAEIERPLPRFPEPDTQAFWEATKGHTLRYQVCNQCGGLVFFPRRHCTHCTSVDLRWESSKGEGTLYTYTIIRQNGHPYFRAKLPYVIAYVDLDEGFRMMTELVGIDDLSQLDCGKRVHLDWEEHEEVNLPVFRLAE
ncbi:MAG: OB-fold domain-containing protein [Firmicutes bacterium]|nr:OB-fold domain-containing protein [Bacillota bacterium]